MSDVIVLRGCSKPFRSGIKAACIVRVTRHQLRHVVVVSNVSASDSVDVRLPILAFLKQTCVCEVRLLLPLLRRAAICYRCDARNENRVEFTFGSQKREANKNTHKEWLYCYNALYVTRRWTIRYILHATMINIAKHEISVGTALILLISAKMAKVLWIFVQEDIVCLDTSKHSLQSAVYNSCCFGSLNFYNGRLKYWCVRPIDRFSPML